MTAAVATELHRLSARTVSLQDYIKSSGLRALVIGTSKDPNAKITVLLVSPQDDRAVLALKAPTTDAAALAVEAEAAVLASLDELPLHDLARTIPTLVDTVAFDGRSCLVTTARHGTAMTTSYLRWRHTASASRVRRDFAPVAGWLSDFQSATAGEPASIEFDGGVRQALLARFADEDAQLDVDLARLDELHERLRRHEVPRTAVHGDFWMGNILLERGRITGVVDWECGAVCGNPVRDLVRFALMYSLYLDRRTKEGRAVSGHRGLRYDRWGAGVEYAITGSGWYPDLVRSFLGDGLARLGAPASVWRDALLAGVAEVAAFTDDTEFARRHLELFRRLASGIKDGPKGLRGGVT